MTAKRRFFGTLNVQPRCTECSVDAPKKPKNKQKITRGGNFTPAHAYTPKAVLINFGMWDCVLDMGTHVKFQLNRLGGFGAPGDRISLSPID